MGVLKKTSDREIVLKKFGNKCAYCGLELQLSSLHIDHIIPKRRGMNQHQFDVTIVTCMDNYNPCCKSCNSSKGSMLLEVWRKEIELKISRLLRDSSTYRAALKFGLIKPTNKPVVFYFEKLNNV